VNRLVSQIGIINPLEKLRFVPRFFEGVDSVSMGIHADRIDPYCRTLAFGALMPQKLPEVL
jgi:hypothetical protein